MILIKKIIISKFKELNKRIFKKKKEKTDGIVVEFNAFQSSHIIFLFGNYFLKILLQNCMRILIIH